MPGCGVREDNIAEIARLSGAREFHFSAREPVESGMTFRNPEVAMGSEEDPYGTVQTTIRRVAATIEPLKSRQGYRQVRWNIPGAGETVHSFTVKTWKIQILYLPSSSLGKYRLHNLVIETSSLCQIEDIVTETHHLYKR